MKKNILLITLICGILFSGCATVANVFSSNEKKDKRLHIISNPSGAKVLFFDKMGNKIYENVTPVKIMIPKGCSYIELSTDGFLTEKINIENRKINPWYWINFIPFIAGAGMAGLSYGDFYTYDRELDNINRELNYWNEREGERYFSQEEINRRNEVMKDKDAIMKRRDDVQHRKSLFYSGIGIGIVGSIGLIADPIFKNTLKGPNPIYVELKMTSEKETELKLEAEERSRLEREKAEADRKEREARMIAEAEVKEKLQNPKNLDRTQYRKFDVSDFSFEIVSGRLPAGSKVSFTAFFLLRPTGTNYSFRDVDGTITFTSDHNFHREMERRYFEGYHTGTQRNVTVYVTVQRSGLLSQCSVDIIDW